MEKEDIDLHVIYNKLEVIIKKIDDFEKRLNGFEGKFDRMNNLVRPALNKILGE